MFKVINIEDTPNPDAVKFILDKTILASGVRQFDDAKSAAADPLAADIFKIPAVHSVFYSGRFITVTKDGGVQWNKLGPKVVEAIQAAGAVPVAQESAPAANGSAPTGDKLLDQINQVIDESIRPALAGDGGGLEVVGLDGLTLTIRYQGACGSCPSSTAGTMGAIQNLLQRMVDPKIKVVSDAGMMGHY